MTFNPNEAEYLELLSFVFETGEQRGDRTGTGTKSIFGTRMEFDLQEGFPLLTTKQVSFRWIAEELLWFLRGEDNITSLQDKGVTIWDEWAEPNGDVGPIYGFQWRGWPTYDPQQNDEYGTVDFVEGDGIDQIAQVIDGIKNNPEGRRHIVSAWNVADIKDMALPPCHLLFQFYVREGKYLDCQLYQRSADMFLGVPYNIASYSLLTHMIAQQTGLEAGRFIWVGGDTHIYSNHIEQVKLQLTRYTYGLPKLEFMRKPESIDDYTFNDLRLVGYEHHPAIKGDVAV